MWRGCGCVLLQVNLGDEHQRHTEKVHSNSTHTHTHLLASEHVMNTTGSPFCTCSQNKHISGGTQNSDDKNLKLEDSS